MRATLESWGHTVEVASDGSYALERALAGPFDVIICDLRMPHLPGARCTPSSSGRTRGSPNGIIFATGGHGTRRHPPVPRSARPALSPTSRSRWPSCAPPSAMREATGLSGVRRAPRRLRPEFRGGQDQARLLARELGREPEIEQRLVTRRGSELARRAAADGGSRCARCRGVPASTRAWWCLVVESRAWRPDLIHAHNNHAVTLAVWAAASSASRVRARIVATRRVVFPVRSRSALHQVDTVVASRRPSARP